MRVRFKRCSLAEMPFTTLGYWAWSKPHNRGTLTIQVIPMSDWRHEAAVWGHEIIESVYCWLFRITTESADEFDARYERGYADGLIPIEREPGDNPDCPYHIGHMLGVFWEHVFIRISLAGWSRYERACLLALSKICPNPPPS